VFTKTHVIATLSATDRQPQFRSQCATLLVFCQCFRLHICSSIVSKPNTIKLKIQKFSNCRHVASSSINSCSSSSKNMNNNNNNNNKMICVFQSRLSRTTLNFTAEYFNISYHATFQHILSCNISTSYHTPFQHLTIHHFNVSSRIPFEDPRLMAVRFCPTFPGNWKLWPVCNF
jgi:hypothetical protein